MGVRFSLPAQEDPACSHMNEDTIKPNNRLKIDLDRFGFVTREISNGKIVKNRCGRDFFYYALNFLFPDEFNPTTNNPVILEQGRTFGYPVESTYVWTGLSLMRIPALLKARGKRLLVNRTDVVSFIGLLRALWCPRRLAFEDGIEMMQSEIRNGNPVGLDIGVSAWGLMDHVMFVYGFDESSVYVFDTHKVPQLDYEKLTPAGDDRFIMRLPRSVIRRGWTRFARIWVIKS